MADRGQAPEQHVEASGTVTNLVDPRLRALARSVDRANRRTDGVEKLVLQLAADLATLAQLVRAGGAAQPDDEADEVPPVRAWLLAEDPDQAAADLVDLCAWVGRVYLRYPRTDLPTCWLWHPHA